MFEVGDYIVYGCNGVCKVEGVGKMDIAGMPQDRDYYLLVPVYAQGSKVFTPTDNKKVMMRPVLKEEEMWQLIDEIRDIKALEIPDLKRREEVYKEALRSCECRQWIRLIKTIYFIKEERKREGKKATASDEKYFSIAKEEFSKEVATVLGIEKDQVEAFIIERMESIH